MHTLTPAYFQMHFFFVDLYSKNFDLYSANGAYIGIIDDQILEEYQFIYKLLGLNGIYCG